MRGAHTKNDVRGTNHVMSRIDISQTRLFRSERVMGAVGFSAGLELYLSDVIRHPCLLKVPRCNQDRQGSDARECCQRYVLAGRYQGN